MMHGTPTVNRNLDVRTENIAEVQRATLTNVHVGTLEMLNSVCGNLCMIREKINGPKVADGPVEQRAVPQGQLGVAMEIRNYVMMLEKMSAEILQDL